MLFRFRIVQGVTSVMRIKKGKINSERGSMSLEFLAMVPYVLLLMTMLWQLVVGAYALITAQSAANEAAKVYSVTEDQGDALSAAQAIVASTGNSIKYNGSRSGVSKGSGNAFSVKIGVDVDLVFLPNKFFPDNWKVPINQQTASRVIK